MKLIIKKHWDKFYIDFEGKENIFDLWSKSGLTLDEYISIKEECKATHIFAKPYDLYKNIYYAKKALRKIEAIMIMNQLIK